MKLVSKLSTLLLLVMTGGGTSAVMAAVGGNHNFACPQSSEIQSSNFSVPSIWLAPAMPHAKSDTPGVGLGGEKAGALLGVETYQVNHKPGWICVYESEGGTSFNAYRTKLVEIAQSNHYLNRFVEKITAAFENATPYLDGYPKDKPLGFIGYQKA